MKVDYEIKSEFQHKLWDLPRETTTLHDIFSDKKVNHERYKNKKKVHNMTGIPASESVMPCFMVVNPVIW